MSDVWQGPGWWLASDGRWYPADAQPGAVYEGDLSEPTTDFPTTSQADPAVAPPDQGAPLADPGTVSAPAPTDQSPSPITPTPTPTPAASTEPIAPAAPDVPTAGGAETGAEVFDEMPAPVVEGSGGGWQAIDPDAVPPPSVQRDDAPTPTSPEPAAATPEPTLTGMFASNTPTPTASPDDGWTSAFEERQTVADIIDAAPSPAAPELSPNLGEVVPTVPDLGVPDVSVPDVGVPDVSVPDVGVPDLGVPDVSSPDVGVPDVTVPDVSLAGVGIPDVGVPEIPIPEVPAPTAAAPDALGTIERSDAWRTPNDTGGAKATIGSTTRPPEVVDLAIPQDAPAFEPEPPRSRLRPILIGVGILAGVVVLAFVITQLLLGSDDDSDAVATDTTQASAPEDSATVTTETTPPTDAPEVTEDTTVSVFDLRAGDCIVGDIGAGQVTEVTKVDCAEEHNFEVYREALIDSSITVFDDAAISLYAEEVCRTSLEAYVPPDDERGLKFKFLQPTEDSWNQAEEPDRVITCLLFDEDAPLVGRAG